MAWWVVESESERDSFRMGVENGAIGMRHRYALVL